MTFSLIGRCPRTGRLGVVVCSSSPAVAARCAHVRGGVGAAASQNVTDPRLGPRLLDLMEQGASAGQAIAALVAAEPNVEHRQLAAVDAAGGTAAFSGAGTLGTHATAEGEGAVAAGNLLARPRVVAAMVAAFAQRHRLDLGDRLLAGLLAGLEAGGEAGPVRSAGLLIAGEVEWPIADLRVDWDERPVGRLAELWDVWKPQMEEYVTRALAPAAAPAFGVPGNERS